MLGDMNKNRYGMDWHFSIQLPYFREYFGNSNYWQHQPAPLRININGSSEFSRWLPHLSDMIGVRQIGHIYGFQQFTIKCLGKFATRRYPTKPIVIYDLSG